VRNVRYLLPAVGLTAILSLSQISSGFAASADHRANVSYPASRSIAGYASNAAAPMLRVEEPVPPNCIRQSCGKLWCWQMSGGAKR
jgi:hypothetical protein